jgi:alpha-amylase
MDAGGKTVAHANSIEPITTERGAPMRSVYCWAKFALIVVAGVAAANPAFAQSNFDDERVMLQGFYWESCRHGDPGFPKLGKNNWYQIVLDNVGMIREGHFDLVWLPPPCYSGKRSTGYNPKQYFKLDNSYGNFDLHRAMLEALLKGGVEPVADLVLNHRDGDTGWVDFKNPDWGLWSICRSDEAFTDRASPAFATPVEKRGAEEEVPSEYAPGRATTYQYKSFRDLDHTNKQVRRDILKYMLQLKSIGYRGWRYDMVHGYHALRVALYNKRTEPTFSVGEYDWDKQNEQRGWSWYTAAKPDDLRTASSVFDFATYFTLKDNKGKYLAWYGTGAGLGLVGDATNKKPWKQRAVTFLENHDTGYRTKEDGTPEDGHTFDSFQNNQEVEQGYAYILTHPGVPCVFWKHYFDWGNGLRDKIKALLNARKVAGVHSGSNLDLQDNARKKGVYAARVVGKRGDVYVRIGGADDDWQPAQSGYTGYREYASGTNWKVWVGLPANPDVKQAPLKPGFIVPKYQAADAISIPDDWLE